MNTVTNGCTTRATQRPFTTFDGHTLAMFDWLPTRDGQSATAAPVRPKAVVLLVHGLGEHAWRYHALATELNAAGFAVRAYDQRGHGESSGARGCLPSEDALVQDLAEVVDDTRVTLCRARNLPLVLLGHSLGGLVSALWAGRAQQALRQNRLPVDALVLSSPAFQMDLSLWDQGLLATLPRWLPNITVGNGLDAQGLSRAPEVVAAYRADPLVHQRVSPRLGRFMVNAATEVMGLALQWRVPTLLMYAGSDLIVNPRGSRRFAQRTPAGVVRAHCFEDFFHEIFNDTHRQEAVDTLLAWLSASSGSGCSVARPSQPGQTTRHQQHWQQ